ncbi:MAG: hypothetical protein IKE66_12830 [Hyphomicrobium sp.]|nr:hypothetical protein [Hyphomicrobium sp.]
MRAMKVDVKKLSDYTVAADGTTISLGIIDATDGNVQLTMDVDQLGMLVMTLPGLIEKALRAKYRDATLRYCHPTGTYMVEQASDPNSLIVTMKTPDGFGVSFSMSRQQADVLGDALSLGAIETRKVLAS